MNAAILALSIGTFLCLMIMLWIIIQLKRSNTKIQQLLTEQIRMTDAYAWEVESKRYELVTNLEVLSMEHRQVKQLNDRLGTEVTMATCAMSRQNKRIDEYHFINSHNLRAPVARILGLAQLLQPDQLSPSNLGVIQRLTVEAKELDSIVHQIQQKLYEAENENQNYQERQYAIS